MGIECQEVPGHSKGIGYLQGQSLKDVKSDHLWNSVLLGGHWFLLDACWGAGRVDVQRESFVKRFLAVIEFAPPLFVEELSLKLSATSPSVASKRFDDFYFLTDPEEFIESHFPDEEKWQLLDAPIPVEEFERRVFKTSAFFTMGLRLIQPHYFHIVTGPVFTRRAKRCQCTHLFTLKRKGV